MMKKIIVSVCAVALLCGTVISTPRRARAGATEAYIAHTTISAAMLIFGNFIYKGRTDNDKAPAAQSAFPTWPVIDIAGALATLGQSAITQWMDKSGKILAKFIGATGHVTDKWVGPPEINKTIYAVDEILQTEPAYIVAKPLSTTSADLSQAQEEYLLAEDQSNEGIQKHREKVLYIAQQQAINALVNALHKKRILSSLAGIHHDNEEMIKNAYSNTKSTLATLESRRGLYNALLILKFKIAQERARLRSQALRSELLPVSEVPEVVVSTEPTAAPGEVGGN